ncbi:MAG: hypothetical protein U9R69_00920 [Thermodesulfobacteriota bacterium]|nr:hypothetical protein [Thermodesulfobacteriota bacterium]
MTIVNSNLPANLFLSAPTLPVIVPEGLKFDLNPGQMVRATVLEGGAAAVIEVNRQAYLAQGGRELRIGQTLNLQVLQIQPRLEFKVLGDFLTDKLRQTLPLLTRPFDWSQLLSQLRHYPEQGSPSPSAMKIYNQLQQILNPTAAGAVDFKGNIALIAAQLQQLSAPQGGMLRGESLSVAQILPPPVLQSLQISPPFELSRSISLLLENLQNQLSLLPKQSGQPLPKNWYADTRSLLAPLQQGRELPQLTTSQRQSLVAILSQVKGHPIISPQLAGEVERILVQIDRQAARDMSRPEIQLAVTAPKDLPLASRQTLVDNLTQAVQGAGTKEGVVRQHLSAEIRQLLGQVQSSQGQPSQVQSGQVQVQPSQVQPSEVQPDQIQPSQGQLDQVQSGQVSPEVQGQGKIQGLTPELLGRLEGLLGRLQQLSQNTGTAPVALPGLETIVGQLTQLVAQPPVFPQGGQLGVLSQLFGYHLEVELLQGKKRAALDCLKLSLLTLQKELGEEVKEPLRRLELFQLCKAKLGEEQVQFLPLPFNELEEGYLLAERRSTGDEEETGEESPLQLSLSLRLSALGNIRIDMLYEKGELHLRLACEDREKMNYLQDCTAELKESLQSVALQGISFSADAQLPAMQLQERLLPDSLNMLDARI